MKKKYVAILDYTRGAVVINSFLSDPNIDDEEKLQSLELIDDNTHYMIMEEINLNINI